MALSEAFTAEHAPTGGCRGHAELPASRAGSSRTPSCERVVDEVWTARKAGPGRRSQRPVGPQVGRSLPGGGARPRCSIGQLLRTGFRIARARSECRRLRRSDGCGSRGPRVYSRLPRWHRPAPDRLGSKGVLLPKPSRIGTDLAAWPELPGPENADKRWSYGAPR
jgi:hypothetical protein